jgi:hypothetical protein
MKNTTLLVAFLLIGSIAVVIALNAAQDPTSERAQVSAALPESKTGPRPETGPRSEVYATDVYLNSPIPLAERIARDSGIPEAIEIGTWYSQNAAPAFINPQPDGSLNLVTPKEYGERILPVLVVGDKEAHQADDLMKWYSTGGNEGQFTVVNGKALILLRDRPRNEFDLGILQLHEAYHAKRQLVDNARASYSSEEGMAAYEHAAVFELEHKVRSAIGGAEYRKLVDSEKQRLISEGVDMGVNPDDTMRLHISTATSWKAQLEAIFGPCGSDQDAIKRDLALWRQAVYELMDQHFPENRRKMAKGTFYTIEMQMRD